MTDGSAWSGRARVPDRRGDARSPARGPRRPLRRAAHHAVAGRPGCFWLLSLNLGRAVHQWRERVRIIAYLRERARGRLRGRSRRPGPGAGRRPARALRLRPRPCSSLKRSLGAQADVVDQLAAESRCRPPSRSRPTRGDATPEGTRDLVQPARRVARGGGGAGRRRMGGEPRPVAAAASQVIGLGGRRRARPGRHPDRDHRDHPRAPRRVATRWRSCGWWAPPRR